MSSLSGTTLGVYSVHESLGAGAFAVVYRAEDTRTGAAVALKVLNDNYAIMPQFLSRFYSEADLARSLPANPHIVQIVDVGQATGRHYLAMELLGGADLAHVLEQRGRLSLSEMLSISQQVADGLACAHRHHVVHRDIKPANIRILPDGTAKILDFGIARAAEQTGLTSSGDILGTPAYIAPEVWSGQKARPFADVYALGIVMYQMLAGCLPFPPADNLPTVMMHHLTTEPRPLPEIVPEAPPAVWWIIACCLAKRLDLRYAHGAAVQQALVGWQAGAVAQPAREIFKPATPVPSRPATPIRDQSEVIARQAQQKVSGFARRARIIVAQAAERMNRSAPVSHVERRLVFLSGPYAGRFLSIKRGLVNIGTHPSCGAPVRDATVWPFHAQIGFQQGQHYIRPWQGITYLNGRQVPPQGWPLRNNDRLRFGQVDMAFSYRRRITQPGPFTPPAERQMAALAHLAILGFPVGGALAVFLSEGRRSDFVGFQAKQALLLQGSLVGVWLVSNFRPFDHLVPMLPLYLLAAALSIYTARQCWQGVNSSYPVIGEAAAQLGQG